MVKKYTSIRKLVRRNLENALQNDEQSEKYYLPMILIKSTNLSLTQDHNK